MNEELEYTAFTNKYVSLKKIKFKRLKKRIDLAFKRLEDLPVESDNWSEENDIITNINTMIDKYEELRKELRRGVKTY